MSKVVRFDFGYSSSSPKENLIGWVIGIRSPCTVVDKCCCGNAVKTQYTRDDEGPYFIVINAENKTRMMSYIVVPMRYQTIY